MEEERRLAYVALTRARKKIHITYVNQNRYSYASHDFNSPSRFIDELSKDLIDFKDSTYIKNDEFIDDFSQNQDINFDNLSPGRLRLLSKKAQKNDEVDWDLNQDYQQETNFPLKGTRVFHQKFGHGNIIKIDGDKADVNFDKSSKKSIFMKYLQFNF